MNDRLIRRARRACRSFRALVALLLAVPLPALAAFTCASIPTTIDGQPVPVIAGTGQLSIGSNGEVTNGTSTVPATGNGTSVSTSAGVQPPGETLPAFQPATFPANSNTNDVTVDNSTLAAGTYDQITLKNTATFSGGNYYIRGLSTSGTGVTLRMAAGDYFIENFSGGNGFSVIVTSGPVRIFIKTSMQMGNDYALNVSGSVANLQIYVYAGGAVQFGNQSNTDDVPDFKGLLYAPYAGSSIQFGSNNDIQGSVLSAGSISMGSNTDLFFDPATQNAIAGINACGMIANYRFDECSYNGTANEIVNSAGSIHASSKGAKASTASPGAVGRYFATDGLNEYGGTSSAIAVPGAYTIMMWLKTPPTAPGGNTIYSTASLASSGGSCRGDFLNFRSDSSYRWRVYNSVSGGTTGTYSISSLTAGWHHFAVVGQGNTSKLYVDGVFKDTIALMANGGGANYGLGFLGTSCDDTNAQAVRMPMDEFMLFQTPLTATDIGDIYAAQAAGKNFDGSSRSPVVCTALHHLELRHSGEGLTCTPSQLTVRACANADCSSLVTTGVTATLSPGGTAFTIGSSGSATATVSQTSTGTAALSVASSTPAQSSSHTCWNTNNSTWSCNMDFADAGFVLSVPNHLSCTGQTLTVSAVKKSDSTQKCVPAFDNGATRSVNLRFSYDTPLPTDAPVTTAHAPRVGNVTSGNPGSGTALTTSSDTAMTLTFNGGDATTGFLYDDAGSIKVSASYSGSNATNDAGLSMSGTSGAIIVAPASFTVSTPAAPLTAGTAFSTTVTAKNACTTPATTTNFGKTAAPVTVNAASINPMPSTGNASAISDTISIAGNGSGNKDLTWNEVGLVDVTATLNSYLGWTLTTPSTGSTTAGRFKPHHFETTVTQGCGPTFTYAGQSFTISTTAYREGGGGGTGITSNYDGVTYPAPRYSNSATLALNPATTGTLANGSHAASDFVAGVATRSDVQITLADPRTAPFDPAIRATETAGDGVTSSGATEGVAKIRSGRARLLNANGSDLLDLPMTLRSEYWASAASGWQINTLDTCTNATISLTNGTLAASKTCVQDNGSPGASGAGCSDVGPADRQFKETGISGFAGDFNLWLKAPGTGNVGDINVTASVPDWLKFNWTGSIANPSAKAAFGRYGTKRVIHIFERY